MGGRADRLVGREHALAIGRSALDRAMSGAGQFMLISGEPGIGKTTVVNALAASAAPDMLVLRGFCWDGRGVPPYWPWSQVMTQAQATGVLADVELGEAAGLVGRGPGGGTGDAAEAADAQFRLFDATARYLARLATDRPTLIALDDLHWADDGTLSLLSFLSRALAAAPVLLLGAYRDTEANAGLAALAERGRHVPLAGLTAAEVDQLVRTLPGDPLPDDAVRQLWRRSGGNPFFVQELATLARSQGAELSSHLPESVIETVRRRLARLPTECVRLLEYAAVAGSHIDLPLLVASGAADSEESAADLLDDAVRARIVTASDQLRFRHDLYRDAILAGTSAARRSTINLAVATALQAGPRRGDAARIAVHLLSAGPAGRTRALEYTVRAAREATARLGHTDAARSYQQAVDLLGDDDVDRPGLVLELAGACARAGMTQASAERYREAADLARSANDAVMFAESALGLHALGQRSGAQSAEALSILDEAARRLEECEGPLALRSQVMAALARVVRHSAGARDAGLVRSAHRAVELAEAAHDDRAVANAYLALHDARWAPGSTVDRLPVITAMLAAAHRAADADLLAQAELLHATALIELGDPAGREVLLRYIDLAERLGHARGRWGALTRQATFAQIAGQVQQAARLGEDALILGRAIGEPDADGCFGTHRWSLVALGVREPEIEMDAVDPLWSLAPLIAAWPPAARGENDLARELLGDFSVVAIAPNTDLEQLAVAAVVFAAVGSADQRRWAYDALLPHAGAHVVIGGCAAYHAAVDHHLGALAGSLGDLDAAESHYAAALSMHRRLGAAGWERVTEQALEQLRAARRSPHRFRQIDGGWEVTFAGQDVRLPAAKGLHDIWVILGAGGAAVHVRTLLGDDTAAAASVGNGADPVLDERARREYRDRIRVMDEGIEDADRRGDADRSRRLHTERDALVRELSTAAGLGGRARRLGDDAERARKTVGARIRDALGRLDLVHPALAHHLREGLQLGTTCCYRPTEPTRWSLR